MTTPLIPISLDGVHQNVPIGASLGSVLAGIDVELLVQLISQQVHAVDATGRPLDPDRPLLAGTTVRIIRASRHPESTDV